MAGGKTGQWCVRACLLMSRIGPTSSALLPPSAPRRRVSLMAAWKSFHLVRDQWGSTPPCLVCSTTSVHPGPRPPRTPQLLHCRFGEALHPAQETPPLHGVRFLDTYVPLMVQGKKVVIWKDLVELITHPISCH